MSEITGATLIGSHELPPAEHRLTAFNPATGAALTPEFRISDEADVARAVDLAWAAFGPYRSLPYPCRAAF